MNYPSSMIDLTGTGPYSPGHYGPCEDGEVFWCSYGEHFAWQDSEWCAEHEEQMKQADECACGWLEGQTVRSMG